MRSREVLFCLLFYSISSLTGATSSCLQLGCDYSGTFTQDGFKLPMGNKLSMIWSSKSALTTINPENLNYGCVGNTEVIVCPASKHGGDGSHVMLHPDTGMEYSTEGYETLTHASMPILTRDSKVFTANASHVALIDPINSHSFLHPLNTSNIYGVLSPVYVASADLFLVFGNWSSDHSAFRIKKEPTGKNVLVSMGTFQIPKTGKDCPWLVVTEPVIDGNRLFMYGAQHDDIAGLIAVDIQPNAPYVNKAWELSDESGMTGVKSVRSDAKNCTLPPYMDSDYAWFPPTDVSLQMLATPDHYIVITSQVGLIIVKDHGDSAEQTGISLFGAHFLSLDMSPTMNTLNKSNPVVWMTGWEIYPPFRENLMGLNYTAPDMSTALFTIALDQYFHNEDANVTSRHTIFDDPKGPNSKIMVFGVRVNTTTTDTPFHREICPSCMVGINSMLMAVRRSAVNTEKPDVVWTAQLPTPMSRVKGQVIGVGDQLVAYVIDENGDGRVVAFK